MSLAATVTTSPAGAFDGAGLAVPGFAEAPEQAARMAARLTRPR
jgi:hypothetical protein